MDPNQALETRPSGTVALTPDQIAAAQSPAPGAPAPVVPTAPAPAFNVGQFDVGTKTPAQMAVENAGLKKQIAQAAVFNAAGGQIEFEAMSAWAVTGRTAQQNSDLNSALNNPNVPDNLRAMVVATAMQEYKAAQTGAPQLVTGDAGVGPGQQHGIAVATEGIDKGEYQGRYLALRKAGKDKYAPEMISLEKQRMQGFVDARKPR